MPSTSPILEQLSGITDHWPTDQSYLVGVSGGIDSVTLLHILTRLGYQDLTVLHLNHGLRGEESDLDQQLVQQIADNLQLALVTETADIQAKAKSENTSIETAAREARHLFFEKNRTSKNRGEIFLAHHADDQAETILLQILRGSAQATGMSTTTQLQNPPLTLLRPLLPLRKDQLLQYAEDQQLTWREDHTNQQLHHTRNRIRHQLLPLASEIFQRDITIPLTRGAQIRQEEKAYLHQQAQQALEKASSPYPTHPTHSLLVEELIHLPIPILRLVLHEWLSHHPNLPISDLNSQHIEQALSLLPLPPEKSIENKENTTPQTAKINLPGNHHLRRKSGTLFVE